MRPSLVSSVHYIATHPEELLLFLKEQETPMFHKSNIFFRDFQYGLWRYLGLDQSKFSYMEVEDTAKAVVDALTEKGYLRTIGRNNYEVVAPKLAKGAAPAPAAPAAKPAAAPKAAPATSATATAAPATTATASGTAPGAALSPEEKARRIAELQQKMAEARARAQAGG